MLFVCYPKCTTCQKAKAWLEAVRENENENDNENEEEK